MIGGRSALLSAAGGGNPYGNWTGNYSDVSLLLRNETIGTLPILLDESPTPKTITQVGDASITTAVVKYGTSAMAFDGSEDYFETPATTDFDFANNPFTIEAWINVSVLTSFAGVITVMNNLSGAGLDGYGLIVDSDGSLKFVDYLNGSGAFILSSAAGVITTGQWYHVAICKEGTSTNQVRLFRNGAIVASGTRNANIPVATTGQPARIGAWRYPTAPRYFNGYIDDLRITKGVARYTSDFSSSLPAELPANATGDPHYSDVSLLLRNGALGPILLDESPTPKTITQVGDASITTAVVKYGTSAMAFDGSEDYFSLPLDAGFDFGTGDFTIECWVNFNTLATDQTLVSYAAGTSGSVISFGLERLSTSVFRCYIYAGSALYIATITPSPAVEAGTWYHVAGVRSGGQLRIYVNGVGGTAVTANVSVNAAAGRILVVGAYYITSRFVNGYIDDLRITKGFARYTRNFLPPPAELPAI